MENILVVQNLNTSIQKNHILKNVSFSVPKGSICAFIGPNGAGKTTTIRSVVGLNFYQSGLVKIADIDVKDKNGKISLGYVPEKENFPKITVKTFIRELAEYYNINVDEINQRIDHYAKLFRIDNKLDANLKKLSSGQKKKIMIIQAFIHNPELFIMDEPTENLDPDTREIFYTEIQRLKVAGKTVVISTHNLDEISRYADYIIAIDGGIIRHIGPWNKALNLHQVYNEFTKSNHTNTSLFTSSANTSKNRNVYYDSLLQQGILTEAEVIKLKQIDKSN